MLTYIQQKKRNTPETFQLTTRVESLESSLEIIQEYIEKVTVNNTDAPLSDRSNPGDVVLVLSFQGV